MLSPPESSGFCQIPAESLESDQTLSSGLQQTSLLDSVGFWWNSLDSIESAVCHCESIGIHWILPESIASPLESTGVCRSPLESTGVCRNPLKSTKCPYLIINKKLYNI